MGSVKYPNQAGRFYPSHEKDLSRIIELMLGQAHETDIIPRALIVPHAGYVFSGPVAASAYKALQKIKRRVQNCAVLSPTHYFHLNGIATSTYDFFRTPLGDIPVASELVSEILNNELAGADDSVFEQEHALEVHLPFLQRTLERFFLLPFIVGDATPGQVSSLIDFLAKRDVLIIVSSDMSHFMDYSSAKHLDQQTSDKIINKEYEQLHGNDACGLFPLRGLLKWAKERSLTITNVDLRNSGDTAGSKDQVVGYGSYLIH